MSLLPGVVQSVLQSGPAQRTQAAPRAAEEARAAAASRELTGADRGVELEIEATDADSRVHSDSGGQGSAGRQDFDQGDGEHRPDAEGATDGTPFRLDIKA